MRILFVVLIVLSCLMTVSSSGQIPRLISYQGVLTDTLGNPRPDGIYTFTFRMYETASGGSPFWVEIKDVPVKKGLFHTTLGDATPIEQSVKFDRPYWLGVKPGSDPELSPRVPMTSVAYSFNSVKSDTAKVALTAISGSPTGAADGDLSGTYPNPTVSGIQGRAVTSSVPLTNQVLRWNGSQWAPASDNSHNHMGQVWTGSMLNGLEINKSGTSGVAITGRNSGSTGSGLAGISQSNYYGVWGETNHAGNNYGFYTPDNLFSLNYNLAGAIMFVVQNDGADPIELGDVVSFTGMGLPVLEGGPPVARVSRTSIEANPAVAGVAYRRFEVDWLRWGPEGPPQESPVPEITSENRVMPGEHLLLCVSGPCQVKVSASGGSIRVGDLLVSSPTPGRAVKPSASSATHPVREGASIGKALQPLESGGGLIYIFVSTK